MENIFCENIKFNPNDDEFTISSSNSNDFEDVSIEVNEKSQILLKETSSSNISFNQFEDFSEKFSFIAEQDEVKKIYMKFLCNCQDEKVEIHFLVTKMCKLVKEEENLCVCKVKVPIFIELFNILKNDMLLEYHHVCLKIIYSFFLEAKCYEFENDDIEELIDMALTMENVEHKFQLLKILLIFYQCNTSEDLSKMNEKIENEICHNEDDHPSICRTSYQTLTNHCDVHFFRLVFLMKENLVNSFKSAYKKFINMYQNYFGEFWTYEIKQNGRLLFLLADIQNLVDTKEFLLIATKDSELKLSIVEIFNNVSEFMTVFDESDVKRNNKLLTKLTKFIETDLINKTNENNVEVFAQEKYFKELVKNKPKIRRLFFGRKDLKSESLFEKILSKSELKTHEWDDDFKYVLNYVWNEFHLWEKPELFTLINPLGKRIIDYVLETENDAYFISFLMIEISKSYEEIHTPNHYMLLKNSLYYDYIANKTRRDSLTTFSSTESVYHDAILFDDSNHTVFQDNSEYLRRRRGSALSNLLKSTDIPVCLIEYHLSLIDENNRKDYDNNKNLLYLLEEMSQFCPKRMGKDKFFEKICRRIFDEKIETFDGENELKLPRKHFYIGLMMIYWNDCVSIKQDCRSIFRSLSRPEDVIVKSGRESIPFFNLLSLILNKEEKEFLQTFSSEIEKMEKSYKHVYGLPQNYNHKVVTEEEAFHFYEKYSTNFCFILLYAAIKMNQKKIIKKIFEYNNFLICCPAFPENMIANDIHYFTMNMFLESKYELGRGDFPRKWIPKKVFQDFLNSRITCRNNFYKIDCNFLLPYYNQNTKLDKIDDGAIANEDYETMEYIIKDYDLAPLVKHPVMEMIIMTKIQKYNRIFFWNLVGFLMLYIFPTTWLVYLLHNYNVFDEVVPMNNLQNYTSSSIIIEDSYAFRQEFKIGLIISLNSIRLVFIIIRELMQMIYIDKGLKNYLKKISNWLECFLIILSIISIIISLLFWFFGVDWIFYILVVFEALNVLLMIIVTTFLYPTLRFSIYMKCFQTVFGTYLMIFFLFLPLFVGCAAMAFIVFDKNVGGQIQDFHTFGNASMKYVVMYAGELNLETDKISGFLQGIAMTLIIILVINKANLILSIVVDDVKRIMDQAKEFSLNLYAEKYVEFAKNIRIFYACNVEDVESSCFNKILFWLVKHFTNKYPHIHQINTLYVEKKTGYVHINEKKPLFEASKIFPNCLRNSDRFVAKLITENWDKIFSHLQLDDDTMTNIHEIIKNNVPITHNDENDK